MKHFSEDSEKRRKNTVSIQKREEAKESMDDRDFIKLCEDALSEELRDPDFLKDLDLMRIRAQKEKKYPGLREEVKRV